MKKTALFVLLLMFVSVFAQAAETKKSTTTTKKTTSTKTTTSSKKTAGTAKKPAAPAAPAKVDYKKLLDPAKLTAKAPEVFRVKFDTSKGPFTVEVHRDWAPKGADRFYNLVTNGYYDNVRFFRVVSNFMAQFGINGDPKVNAAWQPASITDDPVKASNKRGFISYAMRGPDTRTTQLFINFVDNTRLDQMGFAPFAQVVEGMEVVDSLYAGYGEGAPMGRGPDQNRVQGEGNTYLNASFPQLDFVKTARVTK